MEATFPTEASARIQRDAQRIRGRFEGALLVPGDERYDAERQAWNRLLDPRPAVVVEAAGPQDVRAAIAVSREYGLPFAVQSTGHGTVVPADGGVLVKTSRLASVRVDPERRVARAEAGARWSDVIAAAAPYGLAPVSGTPAIGVAGYTLGGGAGWLSRQYGYAADNLLGAEVVTADGELVDAAGHPDLWWALRGGGGNFAVATSLEFRLHPVERVYSGMAMFPADRAAEVLARYRDWAETEPDELNTSIILLRMPGTAGWTPAVRAFSSDPARASGQLESLLRAAGPTVGGGFATTTFAEAAESFGGPPPPRMPLLQHLELLPEIGDDVIEALVKSTDLPLTAVELRHWGGAMARPDADAGPVGHRDAPFSIIATAI
ncbi:FAD-binding oxidoreductase, partial [Nonomuraea sp. NN258]|uniref:FAD-binding oxidoreductase n=1 Tax=Nonomuraea antri TaxID=2730852 RepID=UPI00156A093E